jgi:hypothetical protein
MKSPYHWLLAAYPNALILSAPPPQVGSPCTACLRLMDPSQPEHWITSTAVLELLAKILKNPLGDHAVDAVLDGPLLDVHVAAIFRVLVMKPRSEVWEGVAHSSVGLALHTVLYHLLGGGATELHPPPRGGTAADAGNTCRSGFKCEEARYRAIFKDLSRAKTTKNEALVLRLRSKAFDPSSHSNLSKKTPATKAVAGGGGGGGGDDPIDPARQERGERRTRVAMLLLGGTLESNFASPFRVFANCHTTDILKRIVDLSVEDHADWVPKPQSAEVQQLRGLTWRLEVERFFDREGMLAQRLELDIAQTLIGRLLRSVASLQAEVASGRLSSERKLQQTCEIDSAIIAKYRSVARKATAETKAAGIKHATELKSAHDLAEKDTVERLRAQEHELRHYQLRMHNERNEWAGAAEELAERVAELDAVLVRVRSTSKAGLLEEAEQLRAKVKELAARRTLNKRRLEDACSADQRAAVAQHKAGAAQAPLTLTLTP